MAPEPYLTCLVRRFTALLEHEGLPDGAKVLLLWLVFSADPRTGRVESVTVSEIAGRLAWSRQKVRRALAELTEAGMVDSHLPTGAQAGGRIEVLAFYEVLMPTRWLGRQRAIGENRAKEKARAELPPDSTCDDLADAGLIREAVALAVRNARQRGDALRALHRGRRPA